ncbi:hypothetical protein DFA_05625 [Cavenderia fasciculata]|uniref:ILEI/PANDER domain-containing protein n=1 Tax=Cavenderia fasciculata TaxID=261658 RepID=F4PLS0_CACFS|nr:uncharacterized protein DFA_05625 [Cavenderia fasciculata]EGG23492.1 hypothetical protein DFA_05625 [Cavenderia fasciculata]|eukprot:XP_004361343.1 hypothetical protein DFA_05625 [Cavenderia fasciculata]
MVFLISRGQSDSEFNLFGNNYIRAGGVNITSGINLWMYEPENLFYRESAFPFSYSNYSTQDSEQMDLFVAKIASLYPGTRVAILSYTGLPNPVPDNVARAFNLLGSISIDRVGTNPNFCMIGVKGGSSAESFGNNATTPNKIKAEIPYDTFKLASTNTVASSLKIEYDTGGKPTIHNTNTLLDNYQLKALNLFVFTDSNPTLQTFDYANSDDKSKVQYILEGLPYGTKFALFTNGFNRFEFNDDTVNFLRNHCGSVAIDVFVNDSTLFIWYMVSKVGATRSFTEDVASGECNFLYTRTEDTSLRTQEQINEPIETDISVYSNTYNGVCDISVNGLTSIQFNGFAMCAINEVTGQIYYTRNYDISVCDPTQSANMIQDILDLSVGTVVAIGLAEPSVAFQYGFTDQLQFALESVGASRANEITQSLNYTLIGRKGSRPGSAYENLGQSPSRLYSSFIPRQVKPFIEIEAISEAFYSYQTETDYGYSSFKINGTYVTGYQGNNLIGLNVMIVNPTTGIVQELLNYDTQKNSSSAQAFADKLATLEVGTIVAISVVGGASKKIDFALSAITDYLGSKLIVDFAFPESLCIIATVNNKILTPANQKVLSECKSIGKTSCSTRFPLKSLFSNQVLGVNMCARSKGRANGSCQIMVNGEVQALGDAQGLNVVFVDNKTLVKTIKLYYTIASWETFLLDVQTLEDGVFVLVAINKSMPSSGPSNISAAKRMVFSLIGACKFLLVPDDGSYSVIGIKASSPGSAIEQYCSNGDNQICVASWEPISTTTTTTSSSDVDSTLSISNYTYGQSQANQTIYSVPLFDNYYDMCSPVAQLNKQFAIGNIYSNEPATNWENPRLPTSGRRVKALLIGLEYKKGTGTPLPNSTNDINEHAAALVNWGYVQKENIHILTENLTQVQVTPTTPGSTKTTVCGPTKNCILDEINDWLVPNFIQGDTFYVAIVGRGFKKSAFGGNDINSGLVVLDETLTYSDYSLTWESLLAPFAGIPAGVNVTFVLDCDNTLGFLPYLAVQTIYQDSVVLFSSKEGLAAPLAANTIGFLPFITKILTSSDRTDLPVTYQSLITQINTSDQYKSDASLSVYGNSVGDYPFLSSGDTSKITIYEYTMSVPGTNKLSYFYSRFTNLVGMTLVGAVWKAFAPDDSQGSPVYQYSILTRPVINDVETYNYDYSLDNTHEVDPVTQYLEWYPMGSVWRASSVGGEDLIPVYRCYFDGVTRRYRYSKTDVVADWNIEGVAFYVYNL